MLDQWFKILIISSHTDDAELAMGGTMSKLISDGYELHHLVLSYAPEEAKKRGFPTDTLINEWRDANHLLGVKDDYMYMYEFPTNYFDTKRQEIADVLFKCKKKVNPDVVFVNSEFDSHQDHQVTFNESIRIFKEIGIIGYEFPYNNLKFNYNFLVGLTETDMFNKLRAVETYESQNDRVYAKKDYIEALGRVHSIRLKEQYPYAEAFHINRLVW